ncbi:MAG: S-layer homology domain-containing protein [Deltaproteobacteria bacterium]|nr:S-layer homology domain-containing protein [Deltaproteobacteria bacterium]
MEGYISRLVSYIILVAVVAGCAKSAVKCTAPEDNPTHHYVIGMELVEEGSLTDGAAKFERALFCDNTHSLAHGGMAIVEAESTKGVKEGDDRLATVKKSRNHLSRALNHADSLEKEFAYYMASMRVSTALKTKGWLSRVEGSYEKAMKLEGDGSELLYYKGKAPALYFMGMAYLDAGEFRKAKRLLSDTMDMVREGLWSERAEMGWNRADNILIASGGRTLGDVGRKVAVQSSVARGDLAALLVYELGMAKLFAGRAGDKPKTEMLAADSVPVDILSHHFKEEVFLMMRWGVRGFEPLYDIATKSYLFRPDEWVTRSELAIVLEGILVKITGDEEMRTVYIGEAKAPFTDIHVTAPWYNAVRNVTTRNLMKADSSGAFRPNDPVGGAEVILAITVLRQRMNID